MEIPEVVIDTSVLVGLLNKVGGLAMSYKGIVKDNVVILKEGAKLSDGMRVIVTPQEEVETEPNFDADPFLCVDEWAPVCPEDAPRDLAHQHDHYLYGIEKK